jgi:replicative DNA helicase
MLTVANNAALLHKKRVAIFSLEMSNEQVVQRLVSQQTGIDSQRLRNGKLTEDDWPLFTHAIEVLGDTRIYLDDTPALSPLQLRTKCRRLEMEYGLDLVIVDYLQLMSSESRNENRVQEVSYISRSLKQLARELKVPLIAAAQLSRAVEQRADKEPQLSDLRESGSLEQDADIVMFIYRDEKDPATQNVTHLKVAKHRNGPVGTIDLIFRSNLTKFENAATRTVDFNH